MPFWPAKVSLWLVFFWALGLLARSPEPEVLLRAAFLDQARSNHFSALHKLDRCIEAGLVSSHILLRYAHSLKEIGRPEAALERGWQALEYSRDLETVVAVAALFRNTDRHDQAIAFLEEQLALHPDQTALHFYLAEQLYEKKQWQRARLHFLYVHFFYEQAGWRGAVFRNIALWRLANIYFTEKKLDESGLFLTEYLRYNPDSHAARSFLALRIHYQRGRYDMARQMLLDLVRDQAEWENSESIQAGEVHARLGSLLLLVEDERAVIHLQKALESKADQSDVRGYLHFARAEYAEALKLLGPQLRGNPKDPLLRLYTLLTLEKIDPGQAILAREWQSLARLFGNLGAYAQAIRFLEHALQLQTLQPGMQPVERTQALQELAAFRRAQGEPGLALGHLDELRQTVDAEGQVALALERAEILSLDLGLHAEALLVLNALPGQGPVDPPPPGNSVGPAVGAGDYRAALYFARAKIQIRARALESALHSLGQALALDNRPVYRFYRAVVYHELDRSSEQLADLLQLTELARESSDVANALGYSLLESGDLLRARELITGALQREPLNASYQDSMGWLLFKEGSYHRSLFHLQLAQALEQKDKKSSAEILLHLADVLMAQKRWAQARVKLDQALQLETEERRRLEVAIFERLKLLDAMSPGKSQKSSETSSSRR